MTLLLAFLLLQPPDTKVYPAPGKYCGVVRAATVSKWSVLGIAVVNGAPVLVPVQSVVMEGGKACLIEAGAGSYAVTQWPEGAAQPETHVLALGPQTPIPPNPVPPKPDPPPVPPDPNPTPAGLRSVMIVQETGDKTPQWAMTLNQLRTGNQAKYLKDKGHSLLILDDDSLSSDAKWKAVLQGLTLPALVISDGKTNALIHKQGITHATTADEVLAILKANGG